MSIFGDIASGIGNLADNLAGGLSEAFLGAENTNRGLSEAAARLAQTIEKAAQRTYILDGFANKDKTKPNNRNVITQTPEMIVLIKKSMFNSLSDNYRAEFMDKDEKHFIRAAKRLCNNKCSEIAAYEQLTKLDNIIRQQGVINTPIARMIYNTLNLVDQFGVSESETFSFDGSVGSSNISVNKYARYLEENREGITNLRQVLTLNGFSPTTNWIKDKNFEKPGELGVGTGVIEFTMVSSLTCTNTIQLGGGSGNMVIADPNRLLFVSEADIERAIYQTANTKFSLIDILTDELEIQTEMDKQELNNLRLQRGASIVAFQLNYRTKVYNRVSIILERIGLELTSADGSGIDYNKLDNPNVPEIEQFTVSEKRILNRIYKNIFKVLGGRVRNFENFQAFNVEANYVRKLMRQQFMGKQIIQPMDTITVFVDSQRVDDEMLSFFVKSSFNSMPQSPVSSALSSAFGRPIDLTKSASSFFGSSNFLQVMDETVGTYNREEAEKNIIAGHDFPMWLYKALRPNFTSSNFGTCIFSGVINSVKENHSGGAYNVSVGFGDNSFYFEQSLINTKPGLDQFNGYLYDPVTPFDFEFDASNGLLPEVSQFKLLPENEGIIASGYLRFEDGKYAGQQITPEKFKNPDIEPTEALTKLTGTYAETGKRIFDAPQGFVYRWKRGIGSAIINQSGTSDGLLATDLITNKLALVNYDNPFVGQDVVNIISLLITGQPYNFNTFMQAAIKMGTTNVDNVFVPDVDYFAGLRGIIQKQNRVWGNFQPFKKITTDPQLFAEAMALQSMSYSHSTSIKKKQNERTRLLNKLMQFEGNSSQFDITVYDVNPTSTSSLNITTKNRAVTYPIIKRIIELDTEIKLHEEVIIKSLSNSQISKSVIAIGSNLLFDDMSALTKKDLDEKYVTLTSEQNALTRRILWQVKANVDKNLFIVSSEYDTDYDIQVLAQRLVDGFDLVNTGWSAIKDQLAKAINVIGMELFANSQGHIELRVPKYNKIPSSVLFDMLRRKREFGIQVYPDFLEQTFKNKIEAAFQEIEIIEDQIRLHTIALGAKNNDEDMATFLTGSLNYTVRNSFLFTTNEKGKLLSIREAVGAITDTDYTKKTTTTLIPAVLNVEQDENVGEFFARNEGESFVKRFSQAANTYNNFDIIKQNKNFSKIFNRYSNVSSFVENQAKEASNIITRLSKKLGVPGDSASVKTIPQLLPNSKNGKLSPIDVNNIQNKISGLVSSRHEALISTVNLVRSLDESVRFGNAGTNTELLSKLLMPNLYGTKNIPTFLKGMIENEYEDDFGTGSGKRFIIKEHDIISMSYGENSPDFTQVQVSGAEAGGLVGQPGFPIGNSPDFKIANVWSVDYDLWRMYGFKVGGGDVYLPFLNNPELQLAPYALFLLNKQRANILRANADLIGDEHKQAGEVYYIEDRGMLFYSDNVTHSFKYGGSFRTTLSLTYGHSPGEYIPTPLDVLGKNVYNGAHTNVGSYFVSRSGTTANNNSANLDTIVFPNYQKVGIPASKTNLTPLEELTDGDIGAQNMKTFNDILGKANILIESTIPQENRGYQAITVRVYHVSSDIDSRLEEAANLIIERLINSGIPKNKIVGRKPNSDKYVPGEPLFVNLVKEGENRNASNNAISRAKSDKGPFDNTLIPNISGNPLVEGLKDSAKFSLLYKTIDVWIELGIIPNKAIIDSVLQNPNVNAGDVASTGTNPDETIKPEQLEGMRTFYNKLTADFDSVVNIVNVDTDEEA